MKSSYFLTIVSSLVLLLGITICLAQGDTQEQPGNGNGNGNSGNINKIIKLQATTIEPNANGIAKIMFKTKGNAMQKFQVVGANLKNATKYDLFVDNQFIISEMSMTPSNDNNGAFEIMFSKKSKGNSGHGNGQMSLPASLDPVTKIKHVEIRSNNQVVLAGDFTN